MEDEEAKRKKKHLSDEDSDSETRDVKKSVHSGNGRTKKRSPPAMSDEEGEGKKVISKPKKHDHGHHGSDSEEEIHYGKKVVKKRVPQILVQPTESSESSDEEAEGHKKGTLKIKKNCD